MSGDNKTYGGFSVVSTVSDGSYAQHAADFRESLATGKYDIENSYLSDSGAYVLFENGHNMYNEDEIVAAKAMADTGIIVELGNEGNPDFATYIDNHGNHHFSEGTLSIEKFTYEQATREKTVSDAVTAVKRGLAHCKDKRSQVAVLYDKKGQYHKTDIQRGIKEYEKYNSRTHLFKAILVIDKDGGVHEWSHSSDLKK